MSSSKGDSKKAENAFGNATAWNHNCELTRDQYFPFPLDLKPRSNLKTVYVVPKVKDKKFVKRRVYMKTKMMIKAKRVLHLDYGSSEIMVQADKVEFIVRRKADEIAKVEPSQTEANLIKIFFKKGEPLIIYAVDGELKETLSEIMKFVDNCSHEGVQVGKKEKEAESESSNEDSIVPSKIKEKKVDLPNDL